MKRGLGCVVYQSRYEWRGAGSNPPLHYFECHYSANGKGSELKKAKKWVQQFLFLNHLSDPNDRKLIIILLPAKDHLQPSSLSPSHSCWLIHIMRQRHREKESDCQRSVYQPQKKEGPPCSSFIHVRKISEKINKGGGEWTRTQAERETKRCEIVTKVNQISLWRLSGATFKHTEWEGKRQQTEKVTR